MIFPRTRLALLAWLLLCVPAGATDYFVSPAGNDANPGTTAATAWRSLARVNGMTLRAGDRVFLQGGAAFSGPLWFDTSDGGTPDAPLTIASYGVGRATVHVSSGPAILSYNRAAIRLASLRVSGAGAQGSSGIVFFTDAPGSAPLAFVRIQDVEASGFGQDGIQVGAWSGAPGFADVRIVRASAHDNARTGILTFADRPNVHRDVYIGYSRAFENHGIPGQAVNSGSGIVLGGVDGGTIERSVAHGNGSWSTAREGPAGIWAYDSTRIVIQHNESYGNRTGGTADGGGFDLDQNVSESVVQYNYSHDNDGAGYLLAHARATDAHHGNVVRYNISHDDGRRNGYGAIEIWGRTVNTAIYHNTIVTSPSFDATPRAIRVHNVSIGGIRSSGVTVLNNIFVADGDVPLVEVSSDQLTAAPLILAGNRYHAPAAFEIRWGGSRLTTLTAFRNLGQEQIAGRPAGSDGDPGLVFSADAPVVDDATRLEGLDRYRLADHADARDRGVDVAAFGLLPPERDFFGASPVVGAPDPGAHEVQR